MMRPAFNSFYLTKRLKKKFQRRHAPIPPDEPKVKVVQSPPEEWSGTFS